MKIVIVTKSYRNNVHEFRQHFFDEFKNQCEVLSLGTKNYSLDVVEKFNPDAIVLFTISKVGYLKDLEKFKGPVVLYECDAEAYRGKVYKYLNDFKNIRLATFEFYPDAQHNYPVEHMLWLPPTITLKDKLRDIDRIYDVGHCGDYSPYRRWHPYRLRFGKMLPQIKAFDVEIRGKNLQLLGKEACPLRNSQELSMFANSVKVMLAFPTKRKWLTHQYFYPSANGCLTVGIKPYGFDEQMIPECLVEVREDFADLEEKVKYYLDNEKERDSLVQKAYKHIQEKHSAKVRVKTLLDKIKEIG